MQGSGMEWSGGTLRAVIGISLGIGLGLLVSMPAAADAEFDRKLALVDLGIAKNPGNALGQALDGCVSRRNIALRLYNIGERERALRRLDFCLRMLHMPEQKVAEAAKQPTPEERSAAADQEREAALAIEPDVAHGLEIWRECAGCHRAEGFGLSNGSVPQLAGQHREVVIKQLADIRSGRRRNPLMLPYASIDRIGGARGIADVAAYIDTLEIGVDGDKGDGRHLAEGETLYARHCASCHGPSGEGNALQFVPRIQSQHYAYLVRQFDAIRDGSRGNAHPLMQQVAEQIDEPAAHAILDYVSRLEPPEELRAPPGWQNPDFAR